MFVGSGLYSYVAVCLDADTGREVADRSQAALVRRAVVLGKRVYYGVGTGNMVFDTFQYDEEGGPKDGPAAGAVVCLDIETGKEVVAIRPAAVGPHRPGGRRLQRLRGRPRRLRPLPRSQERQAPVEDGHRHGNHRRPGRGDVGRNAGGGVRGLAGGECRRA